MDNNSILNKLVKDAGLSPQQAKEQMPILHTLIDNFYKEELKKAEKDEN